MNETNCTSIEWEYLKLFNIYTRPVLCVFAFFGNLLTLVVIYRFRKLRTIYNATITSLAVADMLVGFTGFILFVLLRTKAIILAVDKPSTKAAFYMHACFFSASSCFKFGAIYCHLSAAAIYNYSECESDVSLM